MKSTGDKGISFQTALGEQRGGRRLLRVPALHWRRSHLPCQRWKGCKPRQSFSSTQPHVPAHKHHPHFALAKSLSPGRWSACGSAPLPALNEDSGDQCGRGRLCPAGCGGHRTLPGPWAAAQQFPGAAGSRIQHAGALPRLLLRRSSADAVAEPTHL